MARRKKAESDAEAPADETGASAPEDSADASQGGSEPASEEVEAPAAPAAPYRVCKGGALCTLGGVKGPMDPIYLSDLSRDVKEAEKKAADLVKKEKIEKV